MGSTSAGAPTSDDEREILDTIERWVQRELAPVARRFDHADEYPEEIVGQMKELGLFGATIHQDCAARGIETAGGRVSAVVTESPFTTTLMRAAAGLRPLG